MTRAILLALLALTLAAEDPPKQAPKSDPQQEIAALKQDNALLKQKLAATEAKARACFEIYQADMMLNALSKQEPAK